jgi:hypothetical protein
MRAGPERSRGDGFAAKAAPTVECQNVRDPFRPRKVENKKWNGS